MLNENLFLNLSQYSLLFYRKTREIVSYKKYNRTAHPARFVFINKKVLWPWVEVIVPAGSAQCHFANATLLSCFQFVALAGADLGGGCRGYALPPPPPPEMTSETLGFSIFTFCLLWMRGTGQEGSSGETLVERKATSRLSCHLVKTSWPHWAQAISPNSQVS